MLSRVILWKIFLCNGHVFKEKHFWQLDRGKMCGDYCHVNKLYQIITQCQPRSNYTDAMGDAWICSTLGLRSHYHQLVLRLQDQIWTTFWRVDPDKNDHSTYHWGFFLYVGLNLLNVNKLWTKIIPDCLLFVATLMLLSFLGTPQKGTWGCSKQSLSNDVNGA